MESSQAYNILILGETGSGKSTLIEALKLYANPGYTINKDSIGDGIFGTTVNVRTTTIQSDLSSYSVTDKAGVRVNYGSFLYRDADDYEDELNDRKSYRLERENSYARRIAFNLIDTPGLNDIGLMDERNIITIFKALETIDHINLVAITVANTPLTEDLRDTFRDLINLLVEFNGNIVFVHTKIDYARLHPQEHQFNSSMQDKICILNENLGRETTSHLLIDNDIGSKKTIRNCISQNRLRELLTMAKFYHPVPTHAMLMNKTEKMRTIDAIIQENIGLVIARKEEALKEMDRHAQKEETTGIGELMVRIATHKQDIHDIERDLAYHDRDDLVLLYEERFDPSWSLSGIIDGARTAFYYPAKALSQTPGFTHHILDKVDVQAHNIEISQAAGGRGYKFWAVKLRKNKLQGRLFHVKIYIARRKKYAAEIEAWRTKKLAIQDLLAGLRTDLQRLEAKGDDQLHVARVLSQELHVSRFIFGQASAQQRRIEVVWSMLEENLYVRDVIQSAANVEKFFKEKMVELDRNEVKTRKFLASQDRRRTTSGGLATAEGIDIIARLHEEIEAEARTETEALAAARSKKLVADTDG